jgi:succinyl-CoA synthetase beta subunit
LRGKPSADVEALADVLVKLSQLAVALEQDIAEVDVNPLVASPTGCVAVDALVVRRDGG